jgi:hyperosmotically inducible periplasmic protein
MLNLKKLILVTGTSAVIAVSALTGCKSSSSSDRTAGREMDDRAISDKVAQKLKNEPVYKFTEVDVRTFGGVVQLAGFVNSEDQKRRAGELAETIPGVTRVINNISMKPEGLTPTGK